MFGTRFGWTLGVIQLSGSFVVGRVRGLTVLPIPPVVDSHLRRWIWWLETPGLQGDRGYCILTPERRCMRAIEIPCKILTLLI